MSKKQIAVSIVTVLVLAAVGFGVYQLVTKQKAATTPQPKEAAAEFIVALTNAEAAKAYELGSTFYKSKNSPEDVTKFAESIQSDNVTVSNEELYMGTGDDTNKAIYLAYAENLPPNQAGSTSGTFVARLVQEDGVWKVDSLEVR